MISILIPIHNGIEYIDESVNSVLEQTYQDWELLIGINGHQPNSIEYRIAKEYEATDTRIRVLDMHIYQNTNKAVALNIMLKSCKYDWIAILDVDDIWFPTKLEKQISLLKTYDIVGTQCVYFEKMKGINPKIPFGDITFVDFKNVNPIINSSVVLRKELANWNESLTGLEDYDLWLNLRYKNKRFYNIEDVLVKHRIHDNSAFNSKNQQDNFMKIKKNYDNGYSGNGTDNDSNGNGTDNDSNNITVDIINSDNE